MMSPSLTMATQFIKIGYGVHTLTRVSDEVSLRTYQCCEGLQGCCTVIGIDIFHMVFWSPYNLDHNNHIIKICRVVYLKTMYLLYVYNTLIGKASIRHHGKIAMYFKTENTLLQWPRKTQFVCFYGSNFFKWKIIKTGGKKEELQATSIWCWMNYIPFPSNTAFDSVMWLVNRAI